MESVEFIITRRKNNIMFDLSRENSQYKIIGERGVCLLCADCLDALRSIKDNSVDAIVTDPP